MESKSWMILKVLINKYNPKAGNALTKLFSEEEARQIAAQNVLSTDFMPILKQPQQIIDRLHYSWLRPLISQLPESIHPVVLGALTPTQRERLQQYFPITPIAPSQPAKEFFIQKLYSLMNDAERTPLEYLPETDLSPLGTWNKKQLIILIDLLGLYDLASEIRHIVDKRYLENIYGALSPLQLSYLKICLYQKENITSPKLGLNLAEEKSEKLRNILHQRGIARLGKALSGQHPDFIWYLVHTLDVGRGAILQNYYKKKAVPNVTSGLKLQVLSVMNFLKKGAA